MADVTKLTLRETQEFRQLTGFPLSMITAAENNPDVDVILAAGALYYIKNKKTDPDLEWDDVLDLDINEFTDEFLDEDEPDTGPLASAPGEG